MDLSEPTSPETLGCFWDLNKSQDGEDLMNFNLQFRSMRTDN